MDLSEGTSQNLFEQFHYVKEYITHEKIEQWVLDKKPADKRWAECFQFLRTKEASYEEFSRIVEFGFSLPGTSAPVERIFSHIKKIWKAESSQLEIRTVKSILYIKHNLKYSCVEFYNHIKKQPALLRQIGSSQKYTPDEISVSISPAASTTSGDSTMPIS